MIENVCIFTFESNEWTVVDRCAAGHHCPTINPGVAFTLTFANGTIQFQTNGNVVYSSEALKAEHPTKTDGSRIVTTVKCDKIINP